MLNWMETALKWTETEGKRQAKNGILSEKRRESVRYIDKRTRQVGTGTNISFIQMHSQVFYEVTQESPHTGTVARETRGLG